MTSQVPHGASLSLAGDRSEVALRLIRASGRQTVAAAEQLEHLLPGLVPTTADGRRQVGMDTLRVLRCSQIWVDSFELSRIDDYLSSGDLGNDRCSVVDPVSGRGRPFEPMPPPLGGPPTTGEAVVFGFFDVASALETQRTIVLNDAHMRLGQETIELCDDVATAFRAYVQVNCYLSYGDASGFGPHWDDHDVVVIQLAGRKHWEVHEPSELGALSAFTPPGATQRSIWSGLLSPGSALYIPRGWPHSVTGLSSEPSVHLTLSIRRMNGIDLLGMADASIVAEPELLDSSAINSARATWCAQIPTRPVGGALDLIEARETGFANHQIRLTMPGGVVFSVGGSTTTQLTLAATGRLLEIDRASTDALAHLLTNLWTSVNELTDHGVNAAQAIDLVNVLGEAGCLHLRPDVDRDPQ